MYNSSPSKFVIRQIRRFESYSTFQQCLVCREWPPLLLRLGERLYTACRGSVPLAVMSGEHKCVCPNLLLEHFACALCTMLCSWTKPLTPPLPSHPLSPCRKPFHIIMAPSLPPHSGWELWRLYWQIKLSDYALFIIHSIPCRWTAIHSLYLAL